MSRPYELVSTITIRAPEEELDLLITILDDEEKQVGSRAVYTATREAERIAIDVHATDAIALKTAISAVCAIIRTAEEMNTIGE
jgi:tRNA threonylcarbamoyladenosine modification (KEOPS) complex  Pcc1 subunit